MKERFKTVWGWDKNLAERKAQLQRDDENIREEVRILFGAGHSGCRHNNSKYRGRGQSVRFL